jgi:ribonuclease J
MLDDLLRKNVHVFRHESHEVDNCGPLHVSGHASRDEYAEMINMIKPKYFLPIYGDFTSKKYHLELAIEQGMQRANALNIENGDVVSITNNSMQITGRVPNGTILVDQTGAIVSSVVVKDRVLLAEEGLVAVVLSIDKRTGQLLTSPDIISRGFIYMKDSEELMNMFRAELRRAVAQRFKRVDLDRFKAELKDYVTHFLYEQTQRSPIVIPVVNVIGGRVEKNGKPIDSGNANPNSSQEKEKSPEEIAVEQQRRFAQLRQKLLNQDARVD